QFGRGTREANEDDIHRAELLGCSRRYPATVAERPSAADSRVLRAGRQVEDEASQYRAVVGKDGQGQGVIRQAHLVVLGPIDRVEDDRASLDAKGDHSRLFAQHLTHAAMPGEDGDHLAFEDAVNLEAAFAEGVMDGARNAQ